MTITITPLTKNQWRKVLTAATWILAAYGAALLVARLKDYHFSDSIVKLGIPGYVNMAAYFLYQFFVQEEHQAINSLPPSLQDAANSAADKLNSGDASGMLTKPASAPANAPQRVDVLTPGVGSDPSA